MDGLEMRRPGCLPVVGCLTMVLVVCSLCLVPLFMLDAMQAALGRLGLRPEMAILAVVGIFLGGLVNLPVYRIERKEEQVIEMAAVFGVYGWAPKLRRVRHDTLVAVNVGGCIIPCLLVIRQVQHVVEVGGWPVTAMAAATAANIVVCYRLARPMRGVGIMLPGLVSPAVSVGMAWLLLAPGEFDSVRVAVAFTAGVLGPLVGADLLHLKDIMKVSAGMLSIGGAGTFDGIVLSGILAALFA
ncbi:MAG: DUF1614 domain-containing protein [Pirellulales bacterium]